MHKGESISPLCILKGKMDKNKILISIELNTKGRVFEGIGGISSNGTSKLLMDYPEAQRKDILDLLFKPNFGASLQNLKVEIGTDANTSSGTEPSHMRDMSDFDMKRGVGLLVAKKAKEINSDIKLGALRWGLPIWVKNDAQKFLFYKSFLDGAETEYGIKFDFLGADENEGKFSSEWAKYLRKKLNETGYEYLKLTAADSENDWFISDLVESDDKLKESIYSMGIHYTCDSPQNAKESGLPLWLSEEIAPVHNGFKNGCLETAERIIRMYVSGKMVKCELHPLFEGNYETTPFAYKGMLTATWPWSGHYKIEKGLWVVAHFTQFIKPGWIFVDSGCVWEDNIGILTLITPSSNEISVIVLNRSDYNKEIELFFADIFCGRHFHVFKTDVELQFEKLEDLNPESGKILFNASSHSIYSLTTTVGQRKGSTEAIPVKEEFKLPYYDSFENCVSVSQSKYFSDQAGAFEIAENSNKKYLRQVIDESIKPVDWGRRPTPEPYTLIGSTKWSNYKIKVKAMIERSEGYVMVGGRANLAPKSEKTAQCYNLTIKRNGKWNLRRGETVFDRGILSSFCAEKWHEIEISFNGDCIRATVDGDMISEIYDMTLPSGQAVLGSGYNKAHFKELKILNIYDGINSSCERYDDMDENIYFSKGFSRMWVSYNAFNRSLTCAEEKGEYMSFCFRGGSVSVIGKKGPDSGKALIYIDDNFIGEIDSYSKEEMHRVSLLSTYGLEKKEHQLNLVVSGQCNKDSSGKKVHVDAIEVN